MLSETQNFCHSIRMHYRNGIPQQPYSLLFSGLTSIGKTYAAKRAEKFLDRQANGYFFKFSDVLAGGPGFGKDFADVPWLIIDDFDPALTTDRAQGYATSLMLDILESRIGTRHTMVTTNQTIKSLFGIDQKIAGRLTRIGCRVVESPEPSATFRPYALR
jgi:DNA replication protein DnaC